MLIKFFNVIAAVSLSFSLWGGENDKNLALKKSVTLSRPPDYSTTSKDSSKLTDGQTAPATNPVIWSDGSYTLGWNGGNVDIVVDLGEVQDIGGASLHTQAGVSDVNWPESILVFAGENLKEFALLGNLVAPGMGKGFIDKKPFTFESQDFSGRGRYVMFRVSAPSAYFFCDEVAVFKGGKGDSLKKIPVEKLDEFIATLYTPKVAAPGKNIAAGSEIYPISPDGKRQKGNHEKLTDGKFAPGKSISGAPDFAINFFGWSPFLLEVDLGKAQPISGLALFSQIDGKSPLDAIFVCGSIDGENWYFVADLVDKMNRDSIQNGRIAYQDLSLNTQARYLKIALIARSLPITYYFDELEVYEGKPNAPIPSKDKQFSHYRTALNDAMTGAGAAKRLRTDYSKLKDLTKKEHQLATDVKNFVRPVAKNFSSIFPQNEIHKNILKAFAEYLQTQKVSPLSVWSTYRYQFVTPFDLPRNDFAGLNFKVMRNEHRSEVITLLNSENQEKDVTIKLSGDPKVIGELEFGELLWTDTAEGIAVSTILQPLELKNNSVTLKLLPGLSKRLWITLNGDDLAPGTYPLTLQIGSKDYPVSVEISHLRMQTPRLLVGTWDYTDKLPALGLTQKNVASAIEMMDKMHINVPWGGGSIYFPTAADFNEKGDFIGDLKTETFEAWIKSRPGKPMYCVFVHVEPTDRNDLAGYRFGTPEFELRVKNWVKAYDQRLQEIGLKSGQVQWLLVDEVWDDFKARLQTAWSRGFKAANPVVLRNWNNPVIDAKEERFTEMVSLIDSFCSGRDKQYVEADRQFYLKHQKAGKPWWTYSCNGPSRLFDPFSYYRMHGFGSWKDDIAGIGIWSFGDVGGAPAWNEYLLHWAIFAPVAIDEEKVYSTLALEAFREGIENNELLYMLEDAAPSMSPERQKKAQLLMEEIRDYTVKNTNIHIKWFDVQGKIDREKADDLRLQVIELLEEK